MASCPSLASFVLVIVVTLVVSSLFSTIVSTRHVTPISSIVETDELILHLLHDGLCHKIVDASDCAAGPCHWCGNDSREVLSLEAKGGKMDTRNTSEEGYNNRIGCVPKHTPCHPDPRAEVNYRNSNWTGDADAELQRDGVESVDRTPQQQTSTITNPIPQQKAVARRQARWKEYHAMSWEERAQLLVKPNDTFYRSRYESPVIIETHKLLFVPIPKVACTQWLQLFRRMAGQTDWKRRSGGQPYTPSINGLTYLSDYNLTRVQHILTSPEWTRAVFVRDPKERFLSAYLDKVVHTQHIVLRACCGKTLDCADNQTTFTQFFHMTETCHNEHWDVQSHRLTPAVWKTVNFVGHMGAATLGRDASRLLARVGAWEDYAREGWGPDGQQAMFAATETSSAQRHATRAQERMRQYYTPGLERQVEYRFREDYANPVFQLTQQPIFTS